MDQSKNRSVVESSSSSAWWTGTGTSLLAAGLTVGFLAGWIFRGSRVNAITIIKPLQNVLSVGKYLVAHGNVPRTKLALVVRSDLQMTKGKIAAQCGHAAVGAVQEFSNNNKDVLDLWLSTGQTKVVLKASGQDELLRIAELAKSMGVDSFVVRDAGRTEVQSGSVTVVAVGPAEAERVDAVTGSLSLL